MIILILLRYPEFVILDVHMISLCMNVSFVGVIFISIIGITQFLLFQLILIFTIISKVRYRLIEKE